MSKLIYINNVSLDGYCEDDNGEYNFGPMDPEVFRTYIALTSSAPTFLYGKKLYAAMAVWETDSALTSQSALTAEFAAIWQAAHKVVYSSTLIHARAPVPTDRQREWQWRRWHSRGADNGSHCAPASLVEFVFS